MQKEIDTWMVEFDRKAEEVSSPCNVKQSYKINGF